MPKELNEHELNRLDNYIDRLHAESGLSGSTTKEIKGKIRERINNLKK